MADPEDDDAVHPGCSYSSSTFSLTDNVAFQKVEQRRKKKRDLIYSVEAKKKALRSSKDETEYRSAGLDLLAAAGLKQKSGPLLPGMQIDSRLSVSSTNQGQQMDVQTPSFSETEDCDEVAFAFDMREDHFDEVETTIGSLEVMPLILPHYGSLGQV